ncbi:IS66 family insertion sequence element accessory protein TnpB [Cloacibacillus sp.]|uniref:IS66 family insertion sequence element accessory protein TnpB n=1 Tax=Cloacibacillus sp. TaxID=2049023 RepID=UPI0025C3F35A|nr:IS66 family insertion sequence element accessory protein TnpB [Cloacibacillus sp.]MCC8057442.1 IS66 family insertion sequence element accessory protein TnpB [Cloacibacillus sp.]
MIESINKEIYIVYGATDMRKGVDGLAAIVNHRLVCDFSGVSMFIFCNKSRNRVKIIEWDDDGF